MSLRNLEDCHCTCHTRAGSSIRHSRPCCSTYQYCGKERIRRGSIATHEENCPQNPKNKEISLPSPVSGSNNIQLPTEPPDIRA